MFNVSALLLDDALLICVVTEVRATSSYDGVSSIRSVVDLDEKCKMVIDLRTDFQVLVVARHFVTHQGPTFFEGRKGNATWAGVLGKLVQSW